MQGSQGRWMGPVTKRRDSVLARVFKPMSSATLISDRVASLPAVVFFHRTPHKPLTSIGLQGPRLRVNDVGQIDVCQKSHTAFVACPLESLTTP